MNRQRGTVLLTGGSGMVGRNVLEFPAASHWNVVAPSSRELDLRDARATADFIRKLQPEIVIHAAGRVGGIQANIAAPVDFLVTNLDLGRNIVMAAREAGVPRLLNLGSSCMYPREAHNPLTESAVLQGELEPTNEGYALAKIAVARLCQYVGRERPELSYKTLIPCNLYGPHDKFDPKHSHLVPAIIHKVHTAKVQGRAEVEIWGDGSARREFMFAPDLADAIWRAVGAFDPLPQMMNVGVGRDHSVNDYYRIAAEVIGWDGRFVHDTSKPAGMKQKLVSTELQAAWGWAPATSLEDGIRATYNHYLSLDGVAR
ncbi:GDP-L-fucose synthase family protein [Ramlibacter alkalitolerans]|uniref:GDP-L-fucose synthase n=1 Tax=Ramlibacter alkalitolerans TaxID=2039631 RepID=A0ABS1JI03_9BURK|nr:GDP-L-fucose synthase [Ramlibacter alkalitolerans]MBL0423845.1 GDP-L-fucose synthase [Ramlibacter alkalitolerans]